MPLSLRNLNKNVVEAQYAVRGALALRAEQLREEIRKDPKSHPFTVISANIGNPQQLDQQPMTFFRQVLAMVEYPALIAKPPADILPDAVERAKTLLDNIGSVGAYSTSNGVPAIRESIAKFIFERDGYPADPENIYLLAGASSGVSNLIQLLATENAGILIPIPQYPLYSASLTLDGVEPISYFLSEENNWNVNVGELDELIDDARSRGIDPKMMAIINPGNPTGSVLSKEDIKKILKIGYEKDIVVLADEVYQANVYQGEFVSFKKARQELVDEDPKYNAIQLASVHSTSKGFIGECGQRGGYMELVGFSQDVLDQIYKLASIALCPVVSGQVLTELMVNPPKPGDPSYEQFDKEQTTVRNTLIERAHDLYGAIKDLEGVTCNDPQGAMYLFPKITLPPKAVEAADEQGVAADAFYCMELLNSTGICVVPGSGFGQEPGTFHFRTTFLAPGGKAVSDRFTNFHKEFMAKYK